MEGCDRGADNAEAMATTEMKTEEMTVIDWRALFLTVELKTIKPLLKIEQRLVNRVTSRRSQVILRVLSAVHRFLL